MDRHPTTTPTTPAEVVVREARKLEFGDRIYFLRPGFPVDYRTVLEINHDPDDHGFVNVCYMDVSGAFEWTFSVWARTRFAVLTAGTCQHSDPAGDMCTPAPFRLDDKPWPGTSMVCPQHRKELRSAYQARLDAIPAS